MDAHEWYCRQMVDLRNFEMERDHPGVRQARDAREAAPEVHRRHVRDERAALPAREEHHEERARQAAIEDDLAGGVVAGGELEWVA